MFKKKPALNEYDGMMHEAINDLNKATLNLEIRVFHVITKKGVIDLYPDGPDKEIAVAEFEAEKQVLIAAVGRYDGRMQNLADTYTKCHSKTIKLYKPAEFYPNSHTVVERAYRRWFSGKDYDEFKLEN